LFCKYRENREKLVDNMARHFNSIPHEYIVSGQRKGFKTFRTNETEIFQKSMEDAESRRDAAQVVMLQSKKQFCEICFYEIRICFQTHSTNVPDARGCMKHTSAGL